MEMDGQYLLRFVPSTGQNQGSDFKYLSIQKLSFYQYTGAQIQVKKDLSLKTANSSSQTL